MQGIKLLLGDYRYNSVRTNIPRQIMSFSDFPLVSNLSLEEEEDYKPVTMQQCT